MKLNRSHSELSEDVFILHDRMFPVYLIKGDRNFLIDAAITAYQENIYKKLISLLNGANLDSVLLTHSHYDHTGSIPFLQKKFKLDVSGSMRTVDLLRKKKVRDFIGDMNKIFSRSLGISQAAGFQEIKHLLPLNDGERIRIDKDRYLRVIATPGHTRCSISFILMPQKILFPGDAAGVLEKNNKYKPLFLSDYTAYISSLRKLMKEDAEILCPPHNSHIKGREKIKNHLYRAEQSASALKDKILSSLEKGLEIEEVTKLVLEKEFPLPVVEGPEKAFYINFASMVHAVNRPIADRIMKKER